VTSAADTIAWACITGDVRYMTQQPSEPTDTSEQRIRELERQRDELIAALRRGLPYVDYVANNGNGDADKAARAMRDAIEAAASP
jgi:catalase (peroxidase I)